MKATPLKDLCSKASKLRVEDFMQTPTEGEIIEQEASLEIGGDAAGHGAPYITAGNPGQRNYRGIAPDGRFRGDISHHERM
jgi:hypothetical protein